MAFKALVKFESETTVGNNYGITNSKGQVVTAEYLARYIHCWCRASNGFRHNRKENIAFFTSAEFLSTCAGLTASQVGHKAALSPRWNAKAKVDVHADFVSASFDDSK